MASRKYLIYSPFYKAYYCEMDGGFSSCYKGNGQCHPKPTLYGLNDAIHTAMYLGCSEGILDVEIHSSNFVIVKKYTDEVQDYVSENK